MERLPSQVIEDFRLQETVDGRIFYDLNAEKAYVYEDSNRIEVTRPNVRFYDPECRITSILTADSGSVNSKTSDLVARGNVLVKTRDSTILVTDSLVWKNKERMIVTDAPVSMHSPTAMSVASASSRMRTLRRSKSRTRSRRQPSSSFSTRIVPTPRSGSHPSRIRLRREANP